MAAIRCTVLTSHLRLLVKNYSSRLSSNLTRGCDIGTNFSRIQGENKRLFTTQNFHGLFSKSFNLKQNSGFHLCVSKLTVAETTGSRCYRTNRSSILKCSQKDSGKKETTLGPKDSVNTEANDEATLTVFQRFKKTYKEHGKILILVHCFTSTIWFGSFYMAAVSGIDIVPWMEKMGFSDTIMKPFQAGGLGYVALAYLMYKLATPARYTVTLGGTNLAIRYLRRKGKMNPIPDGHSIRNLYKDGKTELRDRQLAFQRRRRTVKIRKERIARHKK